jgi:hypothetical protein
MSQISRLIAFVLKFLYQNPPVYQVGDGLSTSPSNRSFPEGQGAFLKIPIGDDMPEQYKLITEKFGISEL